MQAYDGNKYIAAQGTLFQYNEGISVELTRCVVGPMKRTVLHFWRMVWEYRVQAIVMLTKCVEMGKVNHCMKTYIFSSVQNCYRISASSTGRRHFMETCLLEMC